MVFLVYSLYWKAERKALELIIPWYKRWIYFLIQSMRDHNLQLPDYEELKHILDKEAVREVAADKLNTHYVDFSPIIDFCKATSISPDYFTHWQDKESLQNPLFWEQLKSLESECMVAL